MTLYDKLYYYYMWDSQGGPVDDSGSCDNLGEGRDAAFQSIDAGELYFILKVNPLIKSVRRYNNDTTQYSIDYEMQWELYAGSNVQSTKNTSLSGQRSLTFDYQGFDSFDIGSVHLTLINENVGKPTFYPGTDEYIYDSGTFNFTWYVPINILNDSYADFVYTIPVNGKAHKIEMKIPLINYGVKWERFAYIDKWPMSLGVLPLNDSSELDLEFVINEQYGISLDTLESITIRLAYYYQSTRLLSFDRPVESWQLGRNSFKIESLLEYPEELSALHAATANYKDGLRLQLEIVLNDDRIFADANTYFLISDSAPIIEYTVVDYNPVSLKFTGDQNTLVRYISTVNVTMSATAQKEATITNYRVVYNGQTYENMNEIDFQEITTGKFEFYATDSRGYTSKIVHEAPFIEYLPVTCEMRSRRPTGRGEVNIEVYGNYFAGTFGDRDNELYVYYRYKKAQDTVYSEWIALPNPTIDASINFYQTQVLVEDLTYTDTYVFQAYTADIYGTSYSPIKSVVARPIFDWSSSDFNFNVPVTVMGTTFGGTGGYNILWEGSLQMTEDEYIDLAKPISQQFNGIVLVFSHKDADICWNTFFVPKIMVEINNGGGNSFLMTNNKGVGVQLASMQLATKYLYISDYYINGDAINDQNVGVNLNNVTHLAETPYFNSDFVLRYVLGV